ncbi:MAG TPA: mechanosensitive ion channel family protein [Chitinispirillaceae bacterium]|nr:mechanosensitive ion channel family protein [Chitinispirillaceae bacterium]
MAIREKIPLNILQMFNQFSQRIIQRTIHFKNELISTPEKLKDLKIRYLGAKNLDKLYSFLIVFLMALISGLVIGIIFHRTGTYLQKSADKNSVAFRKIADIIAYFLKKSSFAFGLASMGLIIMAIPTGYAISAAVKQILYGLLIYIAASGLVQIIWNQKFQLKLFSNQAISAVTRNSVIFLRFSLLVYILFCISNKLWPGIAVLLSFFYKAVLIFWIPSVFGRYRHSISQWFENTASDWSLLPELVISAVKNILLRINYIAFIFLSAITLIWMSGYRTTYIYILGGCLQTIGIAFGTMLLMALWISFLSGFSKSLLKISEKYSGISAFWIKNIVLIKRTGLIIIAAISIIMLLQVWGISISGIFNSENKYLRIVFRVISILLGAFIIIQLLRIIVERFKNEATLRMKDSNTNSSIEVEKRVATLSNIVQKMAVGGVLLFTLIMVMDELGFDIKAMLAGVGIVGLAVGFGAQNLVRDIISGLFLIFENRIRVGDVAIINGTGGLVEKVNLRTTILRSADGVVHVFPNGSINTLSNMTHEFSYYVFDIGVCYKENTDKVVNALKWVGDEIISDPKFKALILEPLEIMGVDCFSDSSVVIKARIKTMPIKQWEVGREMNRRIKLKFDKEGIEMPFPHRTVYLGDSAKPFPLKIDGTMPDLKTIKEIVREVIIEEKQRDKDMIT